MFIVGDRPGFLWGSEELVKVGVGSCTIYLDFLSRRHGKKANITFMVGHAESLRAEHILLPIKEVFRRWNQTNESIKNGSMPIHIAVESCVPGRRRLDAIVLLSIIRFATIEFQLGGFLNLCSC